MFLVDSHCHLDGLDYQTLHKNVDDVLAKAAARDVKFCLAVATTLPGYRSMRELVGRRDNVVFSCGVHPLNQDEPYEVETLRTLAAEEAGRIFALRFALEQLGQDLRDLANRIGERAARRPG